MEHKNRRSSSQGFNQRQRRTSHLLPRMATPMMQDVVKRCYQSAITQELSYSIVRKNYAKQSLNHFAQMLSSFQSSHQKRLRDVTNQFNQASRPKKMSSVTMKASHRAFRNKTIIQNKPVGLLTSMMRSLKTSSSLSSFRLLSCSVMVLGGSFFYYNNQKSLMISQVSGSNLQSGSSGSSGFSIKQMAQAKLSKLSMWSMQDMFQKGPVFYVWGLFWFRVFQKDQIHESLLYLLIKAINKPQFVEDSSHFGQQWIEKCVQQPQVINEAVSLSNNVFVKNQEVADTAQNLCEWFVTQEDVQQQYIKIIEKVCTRSDTWDILMWQLSSGMFISTFAPETQKFLVDLTQHLATDDKVQEGLLKEVKNTMSLGSYNLIYSEQQKLKNMRAQQNLAM